MQNATMILRRPLPLWWARPDVCHQARNAPSKRCLLPTARRGRVHGPIEELCHLGRFAGSAERPHGLATVASVVMSSARGGMAGSLAYGQASPRRRPGHALSETCVVSTIVFPRQSSQDCLPGSGSPCTLGCRQCQRSRESQRRVCPGSRGSRSQFGVSRTTTTCARPSVSQTRGCSACAATGAPAVQWSFSAPRTMRRW